MIVSLAFLVADVFARLEGGSEAALVGVLMGVLGFNFTDFFLATALELEMVRGGVWASTEILSSRPINFSMTSSRR